MTDQAWALERADQIGAELTRRFADQLAPGTELRWVQESTVTLAPRPPEIREFLHPDHPPPWPPDA